MKKERINCECGKSVTGNTLKTHLNSKQCTLNAERKLELIELCNLKTKHTRAWLIADGEEGLFVDQWWHDVISGKREISEWRFDSPRDPHSGRPSSLKRSSIKRKGEGNPACTSKSFDYTKDDVLSFIKSLLNDQPLSKIGRTEPFNLVEAQFPYFMFLFADLNVGQKTQMLKFKNILSLATGMTTEQIEKQFLLYRGMKISEGQLASPKFRKMASKMGAQLLSRWRVSKPQKKLFALMKAFDPKVVMEKRIQDGPKFYAYDMYAPSINCLIEMHGDIWHKSPTKKLHPKVSAKVEANLANDIVKENLAEALGYQFAIFWESEEELWPEKIKELYEEIAKNNLC